MSEIQIRNACLEDSPAIARLMSQLGYSMTSDEMKERLKVILSDSDYMTFVAEIETEIVGMIGIGIGRYYERNGAYGRALALVVDEKWRGQGIGKFLVLEAESWFRERGVASVIVNSGKQRHEAHRFYRRLGYEETGLRFVKPLALTEN